MINFNNVTEKATITHTSNRSVIHAHPYRILILGGSGSGETNTSDKP